MDHLLRCELRQLREGDKGGWQKRADREGAIRIAREEVLDVEPAIG